MTINTSGSRDVSLVEAKRRFDRWRNGRRRAGRIPTQLWKVAAQAAATQGVQKTADHLQIDIDRLQQWMDQLGLSTNMPSAHPEFVELPSVLAGPMAECHLEVEEPSGRKLRVLLKGQAVAQAAAVIPAIWRASQQ